MKTRIARERDIGVLSGYDKHIKQEELRSSIALGRVIVAQEDGRVIGWLRWNLFWDNTPFMNMLFLLEGYRGRGYGRAMVSRWEETMKEAGYRFVMTSTLSNEEAQHFYRRLHYVDSGSLLLPGEPLEIIFIKEITEKCYGDTAEKL